VIGCVWIGTSLLLARSLQCVCPACSFHINRTSGQTW
jgi:hypothetical protein